MLEAMAVRWRPILEKLGMPEERLRSAAAKLDAFVAEQHHILLTIVGDWIEHNMKISVAAMRRDEIPEEMIEEGLRGLEAMADLIRAGEPVQWAQKPQEAERKAVH